MSYTALIDKQLLNAMKLAGDLVKTCTISKESGEHFDFASGQVQGIALEPLVTSILQITKTTPTPDRNTYMATIMVLATDIGALDL